MWSPDDDDYHEEDCDCEECLDNKLVIVEDKMTEVQISEQEKIVQSLCAKLSVDPEFLKTGIERLVTSLTSQLNDSVKRDIQLMVAGEVKERVKASINETFDVLVKEAIEQKVISLQSNYSTKEVSIKDLIRQELDGYASKNLNGAKTQEVVKTLVTELLGKDLTDRVKQCVNEIKAETINQIGNEAMKTIVQNTATAIKKDSRLAAILGISN